MTLLKPRSARIAACLLVGALVMAPLSANAAPTGAVPGDGPPAGSYQAKNEDDSAKNAEKVAAAAAREEARVAEAAAKEEARVAEAAAKEEVRVAEAAAKEEVRVAEEAARVAEEAARVAEEAAREEEKAAEGDPTGAVTGPGGAPPSLSPVGATPAEGEVVSIDQVLVPTPLSAAMELFDQQAEASSSVPAPVATPTGMVSGSLVRELAPVLPPLLADVVAAPFVVIEALIDAMAASGQALVIPFLAGAAGFMAPGVRRKHLLAEALGKNPEPVPSNEPRTVFIGW